MTLKSYRGRKVIYSGVTFRSGLEAGWAAYFDACGIPWVYEPKLFKVGPMGSYRPDFEISVYGVAFFVEVKPNKSYKSWGLHQWDRSREFMKSWGAGLALIHGVPRPGPFEVEFHGSPAMEILFGPLPAGVGRSGAVLLTVSKRTGMPCFTL